MAACHYQATVDVVKLLIKAYPDALHLQHDDDITPLDLALANKSVSKMIVPILEGRSPPPKKSKRQQAEEFMERTDLLEQQLNSL